MIEQFKDNILYKLGRNAKENFKLIDEATYINEDYWWCHLDNHPSGHCIIFTKDIERSMLIYAGRLIKEKSKKRNNKKVKIIYCQVKDLIKSKVIGEVIIKSNSNFINIID
jgi:predicted ribosome quality control (RQC) complex YloA/Tae2 family protein